jgi:hypothetical protein
MSACVGGGSLKGVTEACRGRPELGGRLSPSFYLFNYAAEFCNSYHRRILETEKPESLQDKMFTYILKLKE